MKILITSVLLLALFSASAQDLKTGYVVLNNGDTLKGLFTDPLASRTPEEITYRSPDGLNRIFKASTVQTFKLDNSRFFISKVLSIDKSEHRQEAILKKKIGLSEGKTIVDTVFIEVLVDGYFALYKHQDDQNKVHFFIKHKENQIEELIMKTFFSQQTSKVARMPVYKNQLKPLTVDCKELEVNNVQFNEKSLVNFVTKLNACTGNTPSYIQPKKIKPTSTHILAGASLTQLKIESGNKGNPARVYKAPMSVTPFIAIQLNTVIQERRQQWSAFVDLGYKGLRTTSSKGNAMDIDYIKAGGGIRYTDPNVKKLSVNLGFTGSISFRHDMVGFRDHAGSTNEYGFRSWEFGVFLGAGYKFSEKWSLELRGERSDGFSNLLYINTPCVTGYALLRYRLTKN